MKKSPRTVVGDIFAAMLLGASVKAAGEGGGSKGSRRATMADRRASGGPRGMPAEVAAYFSEQSADARERLADLRETIKAAAPDAEERISYQIPAFALHGMLVWYGAFTSHIGFYPGASGITAFRHELTGYKTAKGSVQFPFDRPLPLEIVAKIVTFKVRENLEKARATKARGS